MRRILNIEVCQRIDSTLSKNEITRALKETLNTMVSIDLGSNMPVDKWRNDIIKNHVASMTCLCNSYAEPTLDLCDCSIRIFVYTLTEEGPAAETMVTDSEELSVASHWILPNQELHGLWESLCYDFNIKENLLNFVETTMLFSDQNVNPSIISWNKVVLLHGPPGTGKTSLCKALAQKVAIRLDSRFTRGELVEINSHSLFSKWFSESGKLVMKVFAEIKALLEDPHAFICILIDEVESLAHARKSFMSGVEPSDSIRVVNALLTQLDQMKKYKNVLILTTSNITEAIDLAFVDRADIKQYIGHPGDSAISSIYYSCLEELVRTGVLADAGEGQLFCQWRSGKNDLILESRGLSGRTLRKIPFLAYALYCNHSKQRNIPEFIEEMRKTVINHKENTVKE